MKSYIINDCNVCINPDKELLFKDKNFMARVDTASKNNLWAYGLWVDYSGCATGCGGYCAPVMFSDKSKYFNNQDTARDQAINEIIKWVKREGNHPCGASNKNLLIVLNKHLERQLSLFND